jgi:hypothetical protein
MLTLLAPQLVIDESGYGENGQTETSVFGGSIGLVHQWVDFADYWKPTMAAPSFDQRRCWKLSGRDTHQRATPVDLFIVECPKWRLVETVPTCDGDLVGVRWT